MSHFVTLIRYTQQGVAKIKESPARLDAAKKAAEKAGGKTSTMRPRRARLSASSCWNSWRKRISGGPSIETSYRD
jgi:hypothetical protein